MVITKLYVVVGIINIRYNDGNYFSNIRFNYQVTGTMVASFCLCFFAIIFIVFSGYNLMYHPKLDEHMGSLSDHLSSESENLGKAKQLFSSVMKSAPQPDLAPEAASAVVSGGYFYYGE